MWLHATPYMYRLYLKDLYTAPVIFEVYTRVPCGSIQLHAAPCISRLHLNGLHAVPVVFEVYQVAPCGFMWLHASLDFIQKICMQLLQYLKYTRWLHAALCNSMQLHTSLRLNLKGLHAALVVFEVYMVAPCGHTAPCISRLYLKNLHTGSCNI